MKPAAYVLAALFLLPVTFAFGQYPWPTEPFHESHEITGMFMEYRSTAPAPHFHDGTDIPKPDFSPVYSVVDGRVTGIGGDWVRVEKNSVESYAYVHIDPSPGLSVGDSAKALHTVLGTIQSGQGHVHFKDGRPNVGRQALRADGGLTPFTDNWAPKIENVRFYSLPNRSRLDAASPGQPDTLVGHVQITFRVREPGGPPTANEARQNNGAYIVGYKVLSRDREQEVYVPGNDGVQFRFDSELSSAYVHNVYDQTQSSTSSHVYIVTNGVYQASAFDVSLVDEGDYTILLFAEDTRGNRAEHFVDVTVAHRDVVPPPQPTLTGIIETPDGQYVNWTGGEADDHGGYRLYRSTEAHAGADWTLVAEAGADARSLVRTADGEPSYFFVVSIDTVSPPNESPRSDTYGFLTDPSGLRILIVDGFDRIGTSGSWNQPRHNFAAVHGQAIAPAGYGFETVANEAVIDGLVDLADYDAVIWMVGDESTADETFSSAEQQLVRAYLEGGGSLFVSGSEIAWDLDERGSTTDRDFIRNYLKVAFAGDDAGSTSVTGVQGGIFDGANLTYGSAPYIEDYPDYYTPVGGSMATLRYGNNRVAAIEYAGTFGNGTSEGKLVVMGFPFETIHGNRTREAVMERILQFFFPGPTPIEDPDVPIARFELAAPYPNPSREWTSLSFDLPKADRIELAAYDVLGREVARLADGDYTPGRHTLRWRTNLAPGLYFIRLRAGALSKTHRLVVVR